MRSESDKNTKDDSENKAILITGPNQCGKTKSVQDFSHSLSGSTIYIKIDANDFCHEGDTQIIDDMVTKIKKLISIQYKNQKVNFVLFIDEIDKKSHKKMRVFTT